MAKRTSLSKYLKVCNISYFEYCKYKAEKIKLDIPDIVYNEYCGRTKEFSDEIGCEIIQANMGMGKTAMCEKYLEKHNDKSVLIVTCKRTLANNFKQRFPDFIDYRDIDGKIREEKVICQLESIHRISRKFDIVILDEIHELINQVISNYHNNIMLLRENFKLLITNPIVKCMDANISPLVISTLQTYRGNDFFWNRNTEKNKKDFEFIFNTKEIFKDKFIKSITNGKRVVLTANSKKVLKIAKTICDENDINNLLIFSETPENIKNNITSEILEEVQVFMFSPTITCGVDIQVPFDEVFCYFNNNCNDVNSCIQMTNRVRNINDKKMEIFLDLNHSKENENIDLMMKIGFICLKIWRHIGKQCYVS